MIVTEGAVLNALDRVENHLITVKYALIALTIFVGAVVFFTARPAEAAYTVQFNNAGNNTLTSGQQWCSNAHAWHASDCGNISFVDGTKYLTKIKVKAWVSSGTCNIPNAKLNLIYTDLGNKSTDSAGTLNLTTTPTDYEFLLTGSNSGVLNNLESITGAITNNGGCPGMTPANCGCGSGGVIRFQGYTSDTYGGTTLNYGTTSQDLGVVLYSGTSQVCGDNVQEAPEYCDGTDLAGHTCTEFGYDGGSLTCYPDCSGVSELACTRTYESPATTVITPAAGAYIQQQDFNAVGGNVYNLRTGTDVSSVEYANATGDVKIVIATDATVDICEVDTTINQANADGFYHYGTLASWLVEGLKPDGVTPCDNFAIGDYLIRARSSFYGGSWGNWSDWQTFHIVPYGYVPPVECPDDPSFLSPCWLQNTLQFLIKPSTAAVSEFFRSLTALSDKWPISWFSDSYDALIGSANQTATNFGAANNPNIMQGQAPNFAWFIVKLKSFYGDWAAGGMACFIWLGALVAITRAGRRLLNIEADDGLELGGE